MIKTSLNQRYDTIDTHAPVLKSSSSPEQTFNIILDELSSTMTALKANPKVYWIWNHRRWCLESIPFGPGSQGSSEYWGWKTSIWERELKVVEKMHEADPRNCNQTSSFHEPNLTPVL
jgi:hypothetical protein